ncbi:hypothetical protein JKP88DRAFT_268183 [Tribonema minus]|uniref:Mediator complex subunit 15 KIX domain-containing protein n=1 Tax=Tribonema minus TaxID=303371 RepID=A0A836CHY1_9STRA|nr:hypothetical protein JKP88DRAFT_268183 [Tribonema minus]
MQQQAAGSDLQHVDRHACTRQIAEFLANLEGKDKNDASLHELAGRFENQIFSVAVDFKDYQERINKKLSRVRKLVQYIREGQNALMYMERCHLQHHIPSGPSLESLHLTLQKVHKASLALRSMGMGARVAAPGVADGRGGAAAAAQLLPAAGGTRGAPGAGYHTAGVAPVVTPKREQLCVVSSASASHVLRSRFARTSQMMMADMMLDDLEPIPLPDNFNVAVATKATLQPKQEQQQQAALQASDAREGGSGGGGGGGARRGSARRRARAERRCRGGAGGGGAAAGAARVQGACAGERCCRQQLYLSVRIAQRCEQCGVCAPAAAAAAARDAQSVSRTYIVSDINTAATADARRFCHNHLAERARVDAARHQAAAAQKGAAVARQAQQLQQLQRASPAAAADFAPAAHGGAGSGGVSFSLDIPGSTAAAPMVMDLKTTPRAAPAPAAAAAAAAAQFAAFPAPVSMSPPPAGAVRPATTAPAFPVGQPPVVLAPVPVAAAAAAAAAAQLSAQPAAPSPTLDVEFMSVKPAPGAPRQRAAGAAAASAPAALPQQQRLPPSAAAPEAERGGKRVREEEDAAMSADATAAAAAAAAAAHKKPRLLPPAGLALSDEDGSGGSGSGAESDAMALSQDDADTSFEEAVATAEEAAAAALSGEEGAKLDGGDGKVSAAAADGDGGNAEAMALQGLDAASDGGSSSAAAAGAAAAAELVEALVLALGPGFDFRTETASAARGGALKRLHATCCDAFHVTIAFEQAEDGGGAQPRQQQRQRLRPCDVSIIALEEAPPPSPRTDGEEDSSDGGEGGSGGGGSIAALMRGASLWPTSAHDAYSASSAHAFQVLRSMVKEDERDGGGGGSGSSGAAHGALVRFFRWLMTYRGLFHDACAVSDKLLAFTPCSGGGGGGAALLPPTARTLDGQPRFAHVADAAEAEAAVCGAEVAAALFGLDGESQAISC